MRDDRGCQLLRLRHLVFRIVARVPQPGDIEVVVPRCDLLAAVKKRNRPSSPSSLRFAFPSGSFAEGLLKRLEVGNCERPGLAEGVHIGPHVVDPDALRVGLVVLAAGKNRTLVFTPWA